MRIAFIGFGEAGSAFAAGWGRRDGVSGHDRKTDDPATAAAKQADFARHGVVARDSAPDAVSGADAVFCLVTADQAEAAARAAAPGLVPDTLWFDGNSCSPGAKSRAAQAIHAAGGRYVDMAIMAPVHPKRHHVPLLLSGPAAEAGADALRTLDMRPRTVGAEIGRASAIKMIRSVMVKGLEALSAECVLAAVRAGVADEVLASLQASHPGTDWSAQTGYNLERMQVHGRRRAAEMAEVALTLRELGLPDGMAGATTAWQALIGELVLPTAGIAPDATGPERARAILAALPVPGR
jgi:3-hydroxyisobutyrate dehydrogenase-like beta-hydroxyacid dehydrogenase